MNTSIHSNSTLDERAVEALRNEVSGSVAVQSDSEYDRLRAAWNLVIDHRPDVVVSVQTEADVQAAVRFASSQQLPVTVMSTGHGQPRTCASGVLIRTSCLKDVQIDPESKTATIGAGAVWGEVVQAAFPHGLAPLSGSSPGVGVIGYLLGGGYGLLLRKYGLAIDHVLRFRVVLADGSLVEASPVEHPDLFWALLGGGGAFGVITSVTVSLFPHSEVYGGALLFPAERAKEIYSAYIRWTRELPDDVTSGINLITFPPVPFVPEFLQGRSMVIVTGCMPAVGAQAENWLQPMRDLGPEFDFFGALPFTESARIYNDPVDPLPANGRGVLLNDLPEEAIEPLLNAIGPVPESPNLMIQIRHLGGAMARNEEARSSVGDRRRAKFLIYFLGVPMPHNPSERLAEHAESVFSALQPWILGRGPLNFIGEGGLQAKDIESVFAATDWARLQRIKQSYDPQNLFRHAGIGIA